nr:MAG TPA: hypothetical protein [Bacteriophage sp.]
MPSISRSIVETLKLDSKRETHKVLFSISNLFVYVYRLATCKIYER